MFKKILPVLTLLLAGCHSTKESFSPEKGNYFIKNLTPLELQEKKHQPLHHKAFVKTEVIQLPIGKIAQAAIENNQVTFSNDQGIITAYNSNFQPIISWNLNKMLGKETCKSFHFKVIGSDKLVVACEAGGLFAFDKEGKKIWQNHLNHPAISQILVEKNRIFLQSARENLYAFDLETGDKLWVVPGFNKNIIAVNYPVQLFYYDRYLVQFLTKGFIRALNEDTGDLRWFFSPNKEEFVKGKEILQDNYFQIEDDIIYYKSNKGDLISLKIGSEASTWSRNYLTSLVPLLFSRDNILAINDAGNLLCVSKQNGDIIWSRDLTKLLHYKQSDLLIGELLQPMLYKNSLVIATNKGSIVAFSLLNGDIIGLDQTKVPLQKYLGLYKDKMMFATTKGLVLLSIDGN
jgi:outer membrane protein assembly factor BamB